MDMQLIIDPDTCVGYGECVAQDAEAVELDDQGCAHALVASARRRAGGAHLLRVPGRSDHAPARRRPGRCLRRRPGCELSDSVRRVYSPAR